MSTISNYDLYANYSTAATYLANSTTDSATLSSDGESNFTDILTAEAQVAGNASAITDDTDDNEGTGGTEDDTSSDSTTGTTPNDAYTRPDIESENTANDELSFMDMLALMLLQFQSQSIDDTASTSEMMNQLCMMTNMQAMTSMESSVTEMTATNAMLYNAQLVGQEVTVAYYDEEGNFIEETGKVAASGYYDGVPVIFFEGQTSFHLVSSIMAIGKLPESTVPEEEGEGDGSDTTVDPDADLDVDGEDNTEGNGTTVGDGENNTDSDTNDDTDSILSNSDYAGMSADELLEAATHALG
ncbi:MAG: hypothetical protein R3Y63_02895 [Eubacteriales bacterium]